MVAGLALALSATAIALNTLEERGHLQTPYGQRAFAILLFQDMAVVPLLALLPLLCAAAARTRPAPGLQTLLAIGQAGGAIAAVVLAGRYLLNPLFRLLADTGSREVMTAAALLIVLGTALLMHAVGMSMALGAFLAGVLLAESNYRHELEADIEPFRGLLLALFFMGIGMGINVGLVWNNIVLIVAAAVIVTWSSSRSSTRCSRRRDPQSGRFVARRLGAHGGRRVRLRAGAARRHLRVARRRAGEPAHRHRGGDDAAVLADRQPGRVRARPPGEAQTSASRTISTTCRARCC